MPARLSSRDLSWPSTRELTRAWLLGALHAERDQPVADMSKRGSIVYPMATGPRARQRADVHQALTEVRAFLDRNGLSTAGCGTVADVQRVASFLADAVPERQGTPVPVRPAFLMAY